MATTVIGTSGIINKIRIDCRKWLFRLVIPIFLLFLAHFNEQFYLQSEHGSVASLYLVRGVLFALGLWLSFRLEQVLNNYKVEGKLVLNQTQKAFSGIFVWFVFWYGAWLIIYYPGSYTTDTLDAIKQISYLQLHDWFSIFHPLTYLFLYQILPHMAVIGIAQILLVSFVFADILSYCYTKFDFNPHLKYLTLLLVIGILSSITSIIYYTFFYMRDIPFSFLHLYLAFYVFRACLEQEKLTQKQLAVVAVLGLILSIFRGEGWVILLTTFFAIFLCKKINVKTFLKSSVISLLVFLTLNTSLPRLLDVKVMNKYHYMLTLTSYPLGFILREGDKYITSNREEDKRILSKMINIEAVQKNTDAYDIQVFQHIGDDWKREAGDAEWDAYYKRVFKIFIENPHYFLAARVANFVSQLFAFEGMVEHTNDTGRVELTYKECTENKENNLWCKLCCDSKMLTILKTAVPSCDSDNGVCGKPRLMRLEQMKFNWHWNSVWAFIVSVLVLLLYKFIPISAAASAVILSRIPLIFLTAPCAFVRYVYSLYLFGLFIGFFILLEIYQRIKLAKASERSDV